MRFTCGITAKRSLACSGLTAYTAIKKSNQNSPEFLVIIGAGGLGLMGVQIAHSITKSKIICVDLDDQKLEIAKTHLIKTILSEYNYKIEFEDDAIHYIVESSRSDQGMRDVKRKFEVIISRVNTLLLTDPEQDIVRLKYKILYNYYKTTSDKILILKDHVDIFLEDSIIKKADNGPPPGMYV